ncbi:nucleotidyltransferase [Sulfurovum sp.]|jgi:hypothetical protein|uniref:nucleotidyltransferase domain-containing protein n=1 Tax=Sulfurovum sp. TaxID=1969726 RepID=UPI002A36B7CD|nr:nucleotidyltransferase [Sulfurovum sp.]MDY0402430.1 nucleotidyltransferase [Sulfurovum sp.]
MITEAKHELFTILDRIGEKLDITKTQYKKAKERYDTVGKWLAEGTYCLTSGRVCLNDGEIYPQGSLKLATTVKPIGQEEFDVDLVFYSPNVSQYDIEPSELNRLIGQRLRENPDYKRMMDASPDQGRLKRGWRITYADEFHLDITPSINKHFHADNSELVPDRKLQDWKPSNPKDYAEWFDSNAAVFPSFRSYVTRDGLTLTVEAHHVSDFPENEESKPLLKRYIQILKRHRDVMFQEKDHKPISIIITTLATQAYAYCLRHNTYDNELDLLVDIVEKMPLFIDTSLGEYRILNPKETSENFAERWNEVAAKKSAFDAWHEDALAFFNSLYALSGTHKMFDTLGRSFGEKQVSSVYEDMNSLVSQRREAGVLGLGLSSSGAAATPMKKNTFYGE